MAGPLSSTARAKSLANDFGPTRGVNSPTQFQVALYDESPEFGGVELDTTSCPGYARPTINNADFAADGETFVIEVLPASPTGAWTKTAKYAVLLNAADTTEVWDFLPINQVRVSSAGPFPMPLRLVIYYNDSASPS